MVNVSRKYPKIKKEGRGFDSPSLLLTTHPTNDKGCHRHCKNQGSFGLVPKLQRDALRGLRYKLNFGRPGAPSFDEPPGYGRTFIDGT